MLNGRMREGAHPQDLSYFLLVGVLFHHLSQHPGFAYNARSLLALVQAPISLKYPGRGFLASKYQVHLQWQACSVSSSWLRGVGHFTYMFPILSRWCVHGSRTDFLESLLSSPQFFPSQHSRRLLQVAA